METDRTEGKGQVDPIRQMDEDALAYARALQASAPRMEEGAGASAGDAGAGGTVSGTEGEGVQSEPTPTPEGGQPSSGSGEGGSGQGFLEPYLKDVPEDQRPVVEPVLERYRQEQDANFNRRFEQLQEETNVPVTIYQSLMQDPIQTLNWIADRMYEERGLDVRSQLLERWAEGQQQTPPGEEGQPPAGEEGADKPLTQADLDRMLKEREEQRQQEERQQQFQQQQVQQQQKTVNGWVDEAANKFSLSLDDSQGEDPLRAVIIMQANSLHEQGVARGQAAIEMATESVAKRFGVGSNGNANQGNGQQPVTANGGSPPPSKEIDVSDPKQRKDRMMELFSPPPES